MKCKRELKNIGIRDKFVISLSGKIRVRRTYYKCNKCGMTFFPIDKILGLSKSIVSKRMAKASTWLTIFMPFEHAQEFLHDTLAIDISETCLKDVTHRIGTKLYKEAEKRGRRPESVEKEKGDVETLYLQVDGSMVPIRGNGEREFKEMKLGLVYKSDDIVQKISKNGKERIELNNKRFTASIGEGVNNFKKMFYAQAKEKGYYSAKRVILLTDGAAWISKMKEEYFSDAIHILDWYHVVDHLWKTAYTLYGEENTSKCEKWVNNYKEQLWDGKVDDVIKLLSNEGMSRKRNQTAIWELRRYFFNNKDSMRYDKYRENNYYIGSGAIESANKYIVANRLKQTGMRWTLSHANSMTWLRCKYFEDRWHEFWESVRLDKYLIDHGETHPMAA